MQRQGSCNRCGQCCGADGSPDQDSPWPDSFPECFRNWQLADIESTRYIFQVIRPPSHGGSSHGRLRVGGKNYRYIWVPGHGLCKDKTPWGNTSSYSEECPFLMDDPGDGTRPCAFYGGAFQVVYDHDCDTVPMEKSAEEVLVWQQRHPLCSYTWS